MKIKVVLTGDFALCPGVESVVLDKKEQVLGDTLPVVESAELSFANLE